MENICKLKTLNEEMEVVEKAKTFNQEFQRLEEEEEEEEGCRCEKIDTEEFVFSPSARHGAVTEGDADCRQGFVRIVPLDGCVVSFTAGTVSSSNANELQKETEWE